MAVVWALRSRVALLNMPYLGIMEFDTNLKYLQRICNFDQVVTRSMYLKFFRAHEMPYNCDSQKSQCNPTTGMLCLWLDLF